MRRLAALLVFALHLSPTLAVGTLDDPRATHPDFEPGLSAIRTREWPEAIRHFLVVVKGEPGNADAHNWLGYAYRQQGQMEASFRHYREALRLAPDHRGAHEYIGEAYLMIGDKARAREHLAALERICGRDCEEYRDLARAIAAAK
jgi:Flp pilus assembly protein TadD